MSTSIYRILLWALAIGFAAIFVALCVPPFLENPDIIGALMAGFVNPYSSGYSMDVILCWCVLAVWVAHDAAHHGIRHGWLALLLGLVPGVATGFAAYLLMRLHQQKDG